MYKIEETPNQLNILIPSKRKIISTIFLVFMMFIWYQGEQFFFGIASNSLFQTANVWLAYLWFFFWTVAGILTFVQILWNLFGKEIIQIQSKGVFYLEKQIFFLRRKKTFSIIDVKDISINEKKIRRFPLSLHIGQISFKINEKQYAFAEGVNLVEAKIIAQKVDAFI